MVPAEATLDITAAPIVSPGGVPSTVCAVEWAGPSPPYFVPYDTDSNTLPRQESAWYKTASKTTVVTIAVVSVSSIDCTPVL